MSRIRCCYVYMHVHTSVVTGSVGYYLHYLWCFMVISVAWPIQRPITVWLMNKRVFTLATSVPATHRQVAGQKTRGSDVTGPS